MYENGKHGDLELTVTVYNINEGKQLNKLNNCESLKEYIYIISSIKELSQTMKLEDAINITINHLPNSFLIKEMLLSKKAEVFSMLQTEFDEAAFKKAIEDDRQYMYCEGIKVGREEGRQEGKEEGKKEVFSKILDAYSKGMTLNEVMNYFNISKTDLDKK